MIDWALLGLFSLFVLLAATGTGFPLPEEVALLLAGVYGAITGFSGVLLATCVLGVLCADTLAYVRGRRHSVQFARFRKGARFITQTGFLAVVMSRFFVSTRAVVPYMAGAMRMSRARFHLASLVGAVVSVFVLVTAGRFGYAALPDAAAPFVTMAVLVALTAYLVRAGAKAHLQLLEGTKE